VKRAEKKYAREFCANLAGWRHDVGLTQLELANRIGVSVSLISAYERGAIFPEYSIRHKIDLSLEDEAFRRAEKLQKRMGERKSND